VTERLFSRDEAEAELDGLRRLLPEIRGSRQGLIAASKRITEAVAEDGGGIEGSDWFRHKEKLREGVELLAGKGIILRDPETGLVDFPAEMDGRRVFLCWRLGEPGVDHYHEEQSGYGGRKPL
jgi:hypothetical protein